MKNDLAQIIGSAEFEKACSTASSNPMILPLPKHVCSFSFNKYVSEPGPVPGVKALWWRRQTMGPGQAQCSQEEVTS